MKQLINGNQVEVPIYDFTTHTRKEETICIQPAKIINVEGILIYLDPILRSLMNIKIFVQTDDDERIIRRLQRDIQERGRSVDSIIKQYQETVKPMHLDFVEPSKKYADIIIPKGGYNPVAIDIVLTKIRSVLENHQIRKL